MGRFFSSFLLAYLSISYAKSFYFYMVEFQGFFFFNGFWIVSFSKKGLPFSEITATYI